MPLIKRTRPVADLKRASLPPSQPESSQNHIESNQNSSSPEQPSKMNESITSSAQSQKQTSEALAPPPRSQLRTSRCLESLSIDLSKLDKANLDDIKRHSTISDDPHELYLSSEEDPSESADDSSLFGEDLDDYSPVSSNYTYEETARIVQLFVGKAQMIEIYTPGPPRKPLEVDNYDYFKSDGTVVQGHSRNSSVTSRYSDSFPQIIHPPRSSSKSSMQRTQTPASFLESDPYPHAELPPARPTTARGTKMPTPKLASSATWKDGLKGVSKSFVGHMRRPTLPKSSSAAAMPLDSRPRPLSRNLSMPISVSTTSINSIVGQYTDEPVEHMADAPMQEATYQTYVNGRYEQLPSQPRLIRARNSIGLLARRKSLKTN